MKHATSSTKSQQVSSSQQDTPGTSEGAGHVTAQYKLYPPDYVPKTLAKYYPELFPPPQLPEKNKKCDPSRGYLSNELIDKLYKQYGVEFSSDLDKRHLERKALLQAILTTSFPKSPLNEGTEVDPDLGEMVKGIPYGLQLAYFYYYSPKFFKGEIIERYHAKALESFRKILKKYHIEMLEGQEQQGLFSEQLLQAMKEISSSPLVVLSEVHKKVGCIPPREREKLYRIYSQKLAKVLPAQWARRQARGLRTLRNELHKLERELGGINYPTPQIIQEEETFKKNVERIRCFLGQCNNLANDLLTLAYHEEHFWHLMPSLFAGDKTAIFLLYWYNEESRDNESRDIRRAKLFELLKSSKKHSNPEVLVKKYLSQHIKETKEHDLTTTAMQDTCSIVAKVLRSDAKKRLLVTYVLQRVLGGNEGLELILRLLRNKHPPGQLIKAIVTSIRTDQAKILGRDEPKTIPLTFKSKWLRGVLTQIRALLDYSLLHDQHWSRFLELNAYRVWQTPYRQQKQRQEMSEQIATLPKDLTSNEKISSTSDMFRPFTLRYGSSRRQFIRAMLYSLGDEDQDVQKLIQTLKALHEDKEPNPRPKVLPPLALLKQSVVTDQGSNVHLDLPTYLAEKSSQKKKATLDDYPAGTRKWLTESLTNLQKQVTEKRMQDIYAIPTVHSPTYVAVVQGRKMNSTIFLSEEDEEVLRKYVCKVQVKMSRNKDEEVIFRAVKWPALKQLELENKKGRLAKEQLERTIKDPNILHLASVLTERPLNDSQTLEQARKIVEQNISQQKEWYHQLDIYLQNGMRFERQGTEVFSKQIKLTKIKNILEQHRVTIDWLSTNWTEAWVSIIQELVQPAANKRVYLGGKAFLQEVSKWLVWDCCWHLQELNTKVQYNLVKRLTSRRQLSKTEQEVITALKNSNVSYVTPEAEDDQTDLGQVLQTLKAQWAYHQELLIWYGQVTKRLYQWSATDGRQLQYLKHLSEMSPSSMDGIIETWVNMRSSTKRKNQKCTSGTTTDQQEMPSKEQVQVLVRGLIQLLPKQDQPGLIQALVQEKIDKKTLKDQPRPHEYHLLMKGQHVYLNVVVDRPIRPKAPKTASAANICGNDRGIRKANVLAYGAPASTDFKYVHLHNESIITKKTRQNHDLRYSQRKLSKIIPKGLEGEEYTIVLEKAPSHIQKTAQKVQSIHAKKHRMNKTFVHELTARSIDTIVWTNTTTMVLEYGLSEFQAPAGQGALSRALSQNLWGKYEEMLDYKLSYKTDHPVKIEKTSAAYSSQLCSQHLGTLVQEWQINGLPPAAYQEGFRKAHVCPDCYPVPAPGSTRYDPRGEWFYCAGHTLGEKQTPPTWADRDDNASQNLTYLHWITTQKDAQTKDNYPIT